MTSHNLKKYFLDRFIALIWALIVVISIILAIPTAYALDITGGHVEQDYTENAPHSQHVFLVENGTTQMVFSDHTNVRSQPNLEASVVERLDSGHKVYILKREPVLELGNRSANWYKVRYEKDDKLQTGYVWGANLSVGHRQLDSHSNNYLFLFGVNPSSDDNHDVELAIKVLKNNHLEQSITFKAYAGSLAYGEFKWGRDVGLKGVDKVLIAGVSGEACGIPSIYKHMLWDGTRLIELPTTTDVADAGIFYHIEDYIFPNDEGGRKGYIIINVEEESTQEDLFDGKETLNKKTKNRKVYRWQVDKNGKNGRIIKVS